MASRTKALGALAGMMLVLHAATATTVFGSDFTSTSTTGGTLVYASGAGTAMTLLTTGADVTCDEISLVGAGNGATFSSLTVSPTFTDCIAFDFVGAKVTGFGHYPGESDACDYVFRANGTIDLVCPAGREVTVHGGTCTVHIPPQTNIGTVTYTNAGGMVNFGLKLTGITESHTDGFLCPFSGSGETTSGTIDGEFMAKAQDSEGEIIHFTYNST